MDHVVDGRAVVGYLMRCAEELRIGRALHGGATFLIADVLERGGQQVELQHKLPHVLVLPDIQVDLLRTLDDAFYVGGVVPCIARGVLINYWMYSCTASGPVIFRMSYTYQFHSSVFLLPMRFLLSWGCIQIS